MFNSLPSNTVSRNTWCISLVLHGVVLMTLVLVPLVFPEHLVLSTSSYDVTLLVPPVPITEPPKVAGLHLPVPDRSRKAAERTEEIPSELAFKDDVLPGIEDKKERKESPEPAAPEVRATPAAVVTGLLSPPSSEPTVNKPLHEVQTGGFGDPNGVRGEGRPAPVMIARLGSFDLPAGPGTGNGTGGSRGSKGVVATAGFGNGIAASVGDGAGSGNDGSATVHEGGFGDARPRHKMATLPTQPVGPSETPAEILFKPKPAYTESARAARDEGEVLLRVRFAASGDIHVLDVVRGLPHGLNDSALRAAEQIRFKPATRDGKPVDSVAVVHIVFQMAY